MIASRFIQALICATLFVCLCVLANSSDAQQVDLWNAPNGGLFHAGSNWLDGSAPEFDDVSAFFLSSDYSVFWNSTSGNTTNSFTNVANGNVTFLSLGGTPFLHHTINDLTISNGSLTTGGGTGTNTGLTLSVGNRLVLDDGGQLNITGGQVFAGSSIIGNTTGSASVNVIGADSFFSTGTLLVGGFESSGFLNIQDGGRVASQGGESSITGTVAVGNVSEWSAEERIQVGHRGPGGLFVSGGSTVDSDELRVGGSGAEEGLVSVTGLDSRIDAVDDISVHGNGVMEVRDGASVSANIGFNSGTLNVIGQNATAVLNTTFLKGGVGNSVNVLEGGTITGTDLFIGGESIVGTAEEGTLNIDGAESSVLFFDTVLGSGGTGILNVSNGAIMSTNNLAVAVDDKGSIGRVRVSSGGRLLTQNAQFAYNDSFGVVTVTGADSVWTNLETMSLGDSNRSASESGVDVLQGASLYTTDLVVNDAVLTAEGPNSTVIVDDAVYLGSGKASISIKDGAMLSSRLFRVAEFGNGDAFFSDGGSLDAETIQIGFSEAGTLNVITGSAVNATSTSLGIAEGSQGSIDVTGGGSWLSTTNLTVGINGSALLSIRHGGLVSVQETTGIGSNGSIEIDDGRLEFGRMSIENYARIDAVSGSLAGTLENTAFRNVSRFSLDHGVDVDTSDVFFVNQGILFGSSSISANLVNQTGAEIQTSAGQVLRFSDNGFNDGEMNNFGGLLRFEGSLNNSDSGFIGGRGTFIANGGTLNEGVMAFAGNTELLGDVEMLRNGQLVTSGTGSITTIFDDLIHNGQEIRTSAGSSTVIFGEATGDGDYTGTGTVFFEGDLRPGNSPGIVAFEGDVVLGTGAVSHFEFGGLLTGEFDQFQIDGDLSLDGDLTLSLLDDFFLEDGMEFLIADVGGGLLGQFDGFGEGDIVGRFGGYNLSISYGAGNGNDVGLFTTAVPEPSMLGVLGLSILSMLIRRRRLNHALAS